jgi:RNA methyltransferase, TrmH family
MMISSLSNQKVKYIRRLQVDRRFRQKEESFVVEGTRWLIELLAHPQALQQVFYREDWASSADNARILAQVGAVRQCVSDDVMAAMSATETPPGILAVVVIKPQPIASHPTLMIILDAITDPGNLGTILRSAVAAGVDGALLGPGCVDIYNPKVVRGAMGAHLRLPAHHLDFRQIAALVAGFPVYLATGDGEVVYTDVDWVSPSVLVVGNEAHGGGEQARALATSSIAIPMQSGAESLNAAVAASVILFEAVRQRSLAGKLTAEKWSNLK